MKKEIMDKTEDFINFLISEKTPFDLTINDDENGLEQKKWSYSRPYNHPNMRTYMDDKLTNN